MQNKLNKLEKYLMNALNEVRDIKIDLSKKDKKRDRSSSSSSSSSEEEGISLNLESDSSSSSSFIAKQKEEGDDFEKDSFIASEEDPSSYSSEDMDKWVRENNKKKLKNKRKRKSAQADFFIKQLFDKDDDNIDVDIIGEEDDCHSKDDLKELRYVLSMIPKLSNLDDYNKYISSSPWWKKTFGNIFEEVLENIGLESKVSSEIYKKIILNEVVNEEVSELQKKPYGQIAHENCDFCGYKRHCAYSYCNYSIGSKCFPVVGSFIKFFQTLRNGETHDIESLFKKLLEIRDELYKSYENQKKKK
jgi:hypothetical protein